MSKEYKELKDALLKINALKAKVLSIDSDSNLAEEEKYAKLALLALETTIRSKQ